jgi:hypothetical protein
MVSYYALLTLFTITALRVVNFPLTAFTIFGRARDRDRSART